jgi:hypothetical protein
MKSKVDTRLLNKLHSHPQHTAAIYIYQCLCHVTHSNISIHFVPPATASQATILQGLTDRDQTNTVHTEGL